MKTPDSNFKLHKAFQSTISPASTGEGHDLSLLETTSVHSMAVSDIDDAVSIISRMDHLDADLPDIIRQSRSNPAALVGWKILVEGRGIGVVKGVRRRLAMSTLFEVKYENGKIDLLALKRGANKGVQNFTPIERVGK